MIFATFLALVTGLSLWAWQRERGRLSLRRWLWLGLCRLAGIAILALAFWQTGLSRAIAGPERPQVICLVDDSQSMARSDGDTISRYHRALFDAKLFLQRRRDLIVKIVSAGERALESPGERPEAAQTDIAAWIQQAALQRPDAILLFSDGNHNSGQDPLAAAAGSGRPIFTLGYGPTADSLPYIAEAWAEEQVNLGEEAVINYRLSNVADTLILTAEAEAKPLARQRIYPGTGGQGEFRYRPAAAGRHRIRLYLLKGGDTLDRRTVVFRAEKQKLRVAIWCGRPDWNLRFLQKALAGDPDVGLDIYVKKGERWESAQDGRPLMMDASPARTWEAILLLNLKPEDLDPGLERFFQQGITQGEMSAWFLGRGWDESFRPRAIDDLLPLRIGRGPTITGRLRIEAAYENVILPSSGRYSPDNGRERTMPPVSLPRDCRPASTDVNVIAYSEDRGQRIPCWAWWYRGRSRVLQTTVEDLWTWEMSEALFQNPQEVSFYSHLVRSLVKWLAGFKEWQTAIGPLKPFYYQGQEVVFRGQIPMALEAKKEDIIWRATIEDGQGHRWQPRLSPWGRGQYQAAIQGLPPGDYRWRTELIHQGRMVDRAQGVLFVEPGLAEDQGRAQQRSLLVSMAGLSQGRYWDRQELPGDQSWISEIKASRRTEGEVRLPAIMILAGAMLLMAEWFWRRRWGLK